MRCQKQMVELPANSQNAQGSRETREGRAMERSLTSHAFGLAFVEFVSV